MSELRDLTPLDGDIDELPDYMLQSLRAFCSKNDTSSLPCAKRLWVESHSGTATTCVNGDVKTWWTRPGGEELRVGRFRYGADTQIIFVQAPDGSAWEGGNMVVIVYHCPKQWKVWRGQEDCDEIPDEDIKVGQYSRPPAVIPSSAAVQLASKGPKQFPNTQNSVTNLFKFVEHSFSADGSQTRNAQFTQLPVAPSEPGRARQLEPRDTGIDATSFGSSLQYSRPSDSSQPPRPPISQGPGLRLASPHKELVPSIIYKEGEIGSLPSTLLDLIRNFRTHVSTDPEKAFFAPRLSDARTGLTETKDGGRKLWQTIPEGEQLRTGLFSYADKYKIIVVQGLPGSKWEDGNARIVVHSKGSNFYKIWRGQANFNDIPAADEIVKWKKVEASSTVSEDSNNYERDEKEPHSPIQPAERTSKSRASKRHQNYLEIPEDSDMLSDDSVEEQVSFSDLRSSSQAAGAGSVAPTLVARAGKRHREEDGSSDRSEKRRKDTAGPGSFARPEKRDSTSATSSATPKPHLGQATYQLSLRQSLNPQVGSRGPLTQDAQASGPQVHPNVVVYFLDREGQEKRKRPFAHCDTLQRLFLNARGARIIAADDIDLVVRVGGRDIVVMKDLEGDFEELCGAIVEDGAVEIIVRSGVDN